MQFNDQHVGGAAVEVQVGRTADNMQDFLDIILCNDDQQSQQERQSQQQLATATAEASGIHDIFMCEISYERESLRDQHFVGCSDGKRQHQPPPASAATCCNRERQLSAKATAEAAIEQAPASAATATATTTACI